MRFEGELIAWNEARAFGAIRPAGGDDDVAVGLAAFPSDGNSPRLGELLSFEIVTGRDGQKRAAAIKRLDDDRALHSQFDALRPVGPSVRRARTGQRRRTLVWAAVALGVAVGVWGGLHLAKTGAAEVGASIPSAARR